MNKYFKNLTLIRDLNRYFRMSVFTRDLKKYLHNNSIFTYARLTTITVIFSRDLKYNLTFNISFLTIYIIIYTRLDFNISIFAIDLKKHFNASIFTRVLKN